MTSFNGNSIVKVTAMLVLLLATVVTAAPNSCAKLDIQTDPFSCCTIPKLLDLAVVGKCFEQYPIDPADGKGNKPSVSTSPQTDCMSECILNATAIYDRKGDLNDKKLNNVFLDSLPKNSPWLSVVRDAVKQCGETAGKKENEFKKAMAEQKKTAGAKGGPVCNPEASFLVDCIHTTVFSNCPTTLRSTATDCDAIWKFLKNCPFSALRQ